MATWITHPQIVEGRFDYSKAPVCEQVKNEDEAVEYFTKHMGEKLAEVRRNQLSSLASALGETKLMSLIESSIKTRAWTPAVHSAWTPAVHHIPMACKVPSAYQLRR